MAEADFELVIFLSLLPSARIIEMNHHAQFYEVLGLSPGLFVHARHKTISTSFLGGGGVTL